MKHVMQCFSEFETDILWYLEIPSEILPIQNFTTKELFFIGTH